MEPPEPRLKELTAQLAVELDEWRVAGAPAEVLAELIVKVIRIAVAVPQDFEDAVALEYPSGNWAGFLDAALAADLVPYWNAHADENQVLRAAPVPSGLGLNQQERKPRAASEVSRGAPTPAMIAAAASVLTAAYRGTANGAPEAIQRIAEGALRAALSAPGPA